MVFTIGVEYWMILAFIIEQGGFIVAVTVEVEDWMLLVFITEEERLIVVFNVEVEIADWAHLLFTTQ